MMKIEQLVVENMSWLRHKAQLYYENRYDAEDLAGETIEKILKSKDRFDSRKDFRPWALTVMHNTFITQYNRRKCVAFTGLEKEYSYASAYLADQEAAIRNILSAIRKCARKSVAVECVILYAKGYSYEEISRLLGIPKGTVMSRISNGRKMLRDFLYS